MEQFEQLTHLLCHPNAPQHLSFICRTANNTFITLNSNEFQANLNTTDNNQASKFWDAKYRALFIQDTPSPLRANSTFAAADNHRADHTEDANTCTTPQVSKACVIM